jgi:UDP-glucose 4-epimerase
LKRDNTGRNTEKYVLVTGASGFLGRNVARFFSQQGHVVRGIGHGDWSQEQWGASGLSAWQCADVTLSTLRQYAGEPTTIIHCAGSGSVAFSINDPLADFERTVETTANVLEYVRTSAPSCRVVYPSSASIYGTVESVPIREDCPPVPISQYGTHKLMAEQMVASYCRQFGISAAVVRLFSVYGCGLRKQLLWDACRKFAAHDSTFMGTGDEVRDWLHVEDAATLLLAAAEHASSECPTVNGGSGQGITVRDVLLRLRSSLSQNAPLPTFCGVQRAGDPTRFIADIAGSRAWGWLPTRRWTEGVAEYAAWWEKESL